MRIRVTRIGVMLDQLVHDAHGTDQGGRVEAALGLNPGLAEALAGAGHELTLNRVVRLTEPSAAPEVLPSIKLWD